MAEARLHLSLQHRAGQVERRLFHTKRENAAEGLRREFHFAGGDGEGPGPPGCESITEHSRGKIQGTEDTDESWL